jgi:hypothetical protein
VRITCSIARRRPVGSGPPMTATMPALAVRELLHDRATRGRGVDARLDRCAFDRCAAESGYAQHGETARRIEAGQLGVERRPIRAADVKVVFTPERPGGGDDGVGTVDHAGRRPPRAVNLNDRRRGCGHGVGEGVREGRQGVGCVRHASSIAGLRRPRITRTGCIGALPLQC